MQSYETAQTLGEKLLDAQAARAVIDDFQQWSGGFPPDSEQEIFVYVEYAGDSRLDPIELSRFLRDWMHEEIDATPTEPIIVSWSDQRSSNGIRT